ncbi:hypothetical protein [Streptomyces sp. enrichment culture]|uniref:hypothetical protein n=1 Tax=Streptomyces sp. enrichment culture TaxID=1795815 RepID=UPI003F5729DB
MTRAAASEFQARMSPRRPCASAGAAGAAALVLLLMIPLSGNPVTATVLVFLMGLTGFTVNPVVTALAVRIAGDAATLTSALTTSAFNTGIAAGRGSRARPWTSPSD